MGVVPDGVQVRASELAELRRIKGRKPTLHPRAVWTSARDPKSPLHSRFTWNVRKAAEERWTEQARELIQLAVEVMPSLGEPVRVFVSLSPSRSRGGGYHETSEVLSRESLRRIMLMDALREVDSMRQRFSVLPELAPVFRAADAVRESLGRRGRRAA